MIDFDLDFDFDFDFDFDLTTFIDESEEYKKFEALYNEAKSLSGEERADPAEYFELAANDIVYDELSKPFEDLLYKALCKVLADLTEEFKEKISTAKAE